MVVNETSDKKAPYLDYVTINRHQLELYADELIVKLGKRNAWEATNRLFMALYCVRVVPVGVHVYTVVHSVS